MRRSNLIGFVVIVLCLILLLTLSQNPAPLPAAIENRRSYLQQQQPQHIIHYTDLIEEDYLFSNDSAPTSDFAEVLKQQRVLIEQSTRDYRFPAGLKLTNYTPATNGRPIRSIVLTTWRSGSTFLGDVLNAVPANYYHYEPLMDYGIVRIREPPDSDVAITTLRRLLNCDYTDLKRYLSYGETHEYLFKHNQRLWSQCDPQNICWDAKFLNEFCKLFPFQTMKSVRLNLQLAQRLLQDEELNVKIILLVRDPRGTLQSRKHRDWCPGQPDCENPSLLCADMVSDYYAAVKFINEYPNTFRALRYEDLSLNPYSTVPELFDFLGLDYHANVKAFLDSHTKSNLGGVSSTFRDSKSAPFHWRTDLNSTVIRQIENTCVEAMRLWGYVRVRSQTDIRDFDPITNYSLR